MCCIIIMYGKYLRRCTSSIHVYYSAEFDNKNYYSYRKNRYPLWHDDNTIQYFFIATLRHIFWQNNNSIH